MSNGGANNRSGGYSNSSSGSSTNSLKSSGNSNGTKVTDRQLSPSPSSVNSKSVPRPNPRRSNSVANSSGVGGRVRVAVRLRPATADESVADADLSEYVELQHELKRVVLRKNHWDSESYEFDEVLSEHASQARVYEVVAKPVVESVLEGCNGTVMAYGQTGTGKTYTIGCLGDEDTASRGIMVRAMEHILAETSPEADQVSVSYLQIYKEAIQDLLRPGNENISMAEDKAGDLSVLGATTADIKDQKNFIELLRLGEAHRVVTSTNMNPESSRSHTILMVHVKRSINGKDSSISNENGNVALPAKTLKPVVRKGKLMVVDLAGSENTTKAGSEGLALEEAKSINLSLSVLGKCINALAANDSHIPVRESKLTRLLRDSLGGSARTSLLITIGPSPRHKAETQNAIAFGQRAVKVKNTVKARVEFDYKALSRKLQHQIDQLSAANERKQKAFQDEIERIALEAKNHNAEVERNYADLLEKERLNIEKSYMDLMEKLQEQLHANGKVGLQLKDESNKLHDEQYGKLLAELDETKQLLRNETLQRKAAEEEISSLRNQWKKFESAKNSEILKLQKMLEAESDEKAQLQEDIVELQDRLFQMSNEADETRRILDKEDSMKLSGKLGSLISHNHQTSRDSVDAKLHRQVGLEAILALLESEDADADARINALKVVANLAAQESKQEKIVNAGGLTSLLRLLRNCDDETIHLFAAGAIANLAMNETYQELIASEGGINLLAVAAVKAKDPQTLRLLAAAIANLCGNDKLLAKLRGEGGIKALLGMVKCKHPDVLAQAARGIGNFAKCESRAFPQGIKTGKSFLIEDDALPWIVQNANNEAYSIRRHIELALCHLAQHEANARDMITTGAVWQLVRISQYCSRDDIRTLAHTALTCTPSFVAELQ